MFRLFVILLVVSAALASCARSAKKLVRQGVIPDTNVYTLSLNQQVTQEKIRVLYTGCGGLVIFRGNEAVMTDPYYTGHHWWNLLWKKPDPKHNQKILEKINSIDTAKHVSAVMISHSHYDHLEDLPYLLHNNSLNDRLKIIGDSSTHCTVASFMKPGHTFIYSDNTAYRHGSPDPLNWIQISEHIRVLVIASDHAPHYRGLHALKGNSCNQKRPALKKPGSRSSAGSWREGKTFSFLIDIMDDANTKPVLRLYVQSSSCLPPNGFPPQYLFAEKKVDLAFIGVASFANVEPYPKDILQWLEPEKIVLIHWEDFFRNFYREKQKTLRLNKVDRFIRSLQLQYNNPDIRDLNKRVSMPKPLTEIKIEN